MSDKILVVDASPLIYATFSKVGHLSTSSGIPTGLSYGFLRSIKSYQTKTKANKVVLTFDLPGAIKKAEGREEYKSDRIFTEEKSTMYGQVPDLRKMLSMTKWTQIDAQGYEADDIIGAVARAKGSRGDDVVIVTTDNDMMQLVNDNVRIWYPAKAAKGKRAATKDRYVDSSGVFEHFGVWPEHLLFYRSLAGDKSDNLKGCPVGDGPLSELRDLLAKTPRGWTPEELQEYTSENLPEGNPLKVLSSEFQEILANNLHIMDLKRPDNMNVQQGQKDPVALEDLFTKLEFKSMMKFIPELTGTV